MLTGADRWSMSNCTRTINFLGQERTLVMGIVNITPDSFSGDGRLSNIDHALAQVREMIDDGADIIDIGAESTRPNYTPVSVDEEMSRLEPVLRALIDCPLPISIDTYKPAVAQAAIDLGADFINTVHVGREMIECAARNDCPLVVTHNRSADDLIDDIKNFFDRTIETAIDVGLDQEKLIFDPGIGFGKTQEQNLMILRQLEKLKKYRPLLLGFSRKSVIGYALGLPLDLRDETTGAWSVIEAMKGADILRIHNVKLIAPMLRATDVLVKR